MALRGEVVDLSRADFLHEPAEAIGVGEIAVMQMQPSVGFVGVAVEMVEATGVEARGAANDAVNLVTLGEQELGEVAAILSGDASDERDLGGCGRLGHRVIA